MSVSSGMAERPGLTSNTADQLSPPRGPTSGSAHVTAGTRCMLGLVMAPLKRVCLTHLTASWSVQS